MKIKTIALLIVLIMGFSVTMGCVEDTTNTYFDGAVLVTLETENRRGMNDFITFEFKETGNFTISVINGKLSDFSINVSTIPFRVVKSSTDFSNLEIEISWNGTSQINSFADTENGLNYMWFGLIIVGCVVSMVCGIALIMSKRDKRDWMLFCLVGAVALAIVASIGLII